jgi:hypothetical protein
MIQRDWFVSLGFFCLVLCSCSGKKIILENGNKVSKEGVSVWANWIKEKGKKFDVEIGITNGSNKDIIIMLGDMDCSRGTSSGALKHTFFNTGERTIDFRVGQTKSFRMVCDYRTNVQGPFKIVVRRVFENPGGDGRAKGTVLTENIEWKAEEAK